VVLNCYYLIVLILSVYYVYIINRYLRGWQTLPYWKIPSNYKALTKLSILVPARNEEDNIVDCVQSILSQNYPSSLFEIIVIDDHSTDRTPELVLGINSNQVRLLKLADYVNEADTRSFKKKAIETAMKKATGQLIVTTDADCEMGPNWLLSIVSYYELNKPKFIAAPVNFYKEKSLLERFQSLDFMGMMCVTGAGIHRRFMNMCNGANLAYEKQAFYDVNGFEGIDNIASGDDMLLMQKIAKKFPNDIGFVKNKEAVVYTTAKPTVRAFISQRIRWASKSTSYEEWQVTFILAMVFFFCCSIVFSLLMIPFWGPWLFLFQLMVKIIMDFFFLNRMSIFFNRQELMKSFIPSLFLHIAYIVLIGILANFVKEYQWKGRKTS